MTVINDLPLSEKPREKALKYGVDQLSTRELLALILRSGTKGKSALELADEILHQSGGVRGASVMTLQDLCSIHGISTVKALEIQACFELHRRVLLDKAVNEDIIQSPQILIEWLQNEMGMLLQERMYVIYLSNSNHILRYEDLFRGTIDSTGVYPREILRSAILYGSSRIILVHNHPSQNPSPSREDIDATARIMDAGQLMDVEILDHIIISSDAYFSFAENGLLNECKNNEQRRHQW